MPLKPCLKSSRALSQEDTSIVVTCHPPIPEPTSQLPRTSSYIDYSALPYSHVYVHFPPSPTLTSTHVVDPPLLYDRSPIIVTENSCAMPQRGCPGRTYATIDGVGSGVASSKNALALSCSKLAFSPSASSTMSALVRDDQGSSDHSDAISQDLSALCHALCSPSHHSPMCRAHRTLAATETANSQFLPHLRLSSRSSKSSDGLTKSPSHPSSSFTSAWDTSSCLEGF